MNTTEFKKLLKPLIKQTIKEVILEEGILSNIVSEVAKGLSGGLVVEARAKKNDEVELARREEAYEKDRQERIKRLNESTKLGSKLFENTKPIPEASGHGPLAGTSAQDAGVDISAIQSLSKGKWKHLI